MPRFAIVSLALGLLCTAVRASNPVFGAYPSDSCDSCLDAVYESCPGDYETRSYATCMCAGDGSANFLTCMSSCDVAFNEQANAASAFYAYCTLFFKEMCPAAEGTLDNEIFVEQCSEEAIAAGGIGANTDSGSGSDSDTDTSAGVEPTKTGSTSEETGKTSETTRASSGATNVIIPAWAIVAGLGLQLVNI